jgi:hypothetical protein
MRIDFLDSVSDGLHDDPGGGPECGPPVALIPEWIMTRLARPGSTLALGALMAITVGCNAGPKDGSPEIFSNAAMSEVGSMYESFILDFKKPPTKPADFTRYEDGFPTGIGQLKANNILVFWGATLSDDSSDKVLAYEKATPDSGGLVLMQDGKMIKKMTAAEFRDAPKAGTTATFGEAATGKK